MKMAIEDDDYPRQIKGLVPMLPLQRLYLNCSIMFQQPSWIHYPRATPCSSTQLGFTSDSLSPAFIFLQKLLC